MQMRLKQSCAQTILRLIYARKKRKNQSREPERDRTWRLIWYKQNYRRETGTDLGLLSFNASAMRSLIKMKRCASGLPPAAAGRAKTACPHSHFSGVTMGWCAKHFSGLSCLQCESAAGGKEVEPAP